MLLIHMLRCCSWCFSKISTSQSWTMKKLVQRLSTKSAVKLLTGNIGRTRCLPGSRGLLADSNVFDKLDG